MSNDQSKLSRRNALKCMAYGGAGTLFVMAGGVFTPVDEGGTQIEYDKEDPEIRRMFERALATKGLKADMPL